MEEKFSIRLDWLSLDKEELRLYIGDLHSYLLDFSTSSIHDMLLELDNVARIVADDLSLIATGRGGAARFLTESKDDKQFERVMQLIKMIKDFKEVSDMAKALRPPVIKAKEFLEGGDSVVTQPKKLEGLGNVFEQAQKKATSGKK